MEQTKESPKKVTAKKVISWLGTVLMLISLGFIVRRFMNYGIDFSWLNSPWVVAGLSAVAVGEGMAMVGASLNFRALLKNISGMAVRRPLAMEVYLVSNLYKYIPGGVMYVAGRHRMVVETTGLTHSKMVFSTIIEGVLIVIGALAVAMALSFSYVTTYVIEQIDLLRILLPVLGILIAAGAPAAYIFRKKISAALKKFWETVEIFKPAVLFKRLGFALILMFLWGLTFLLTLMLLGQPVHLTLAGAIIGLYLLAWLAGFLMPGAPSGLGIREVVMMMFLPEIVYYDILLAALIMHRAVTMAGDVFAYGVGTMYAKIKGGISHA